MHALPMVQMLPSDIKGTELPPANILIPPERQLIALQLCRWQFLYNERNHSGFYWSKRWWGGNGISWTICIWFAPRSRQITTPVPNHSVFTGQMPFLPPNQSASKHWRQPLYHLVKGYITPSNKGRYGTRIFRETHIFKHPLWNSALSRVN